MKKTILIIVALIAGIVGNAQNINQTHLGGNSYQYNLLDAMDFPGYYAEIGQEMPKKGYSYFWYTNTGHVSHQQSPMFKFHSPAPHQINLVLTPRKRPNNNGTNHKVNATPYYASNMVGTTQNVRIDHLPIYFDTEAKLNDTVYLIIPLSSCKSPNTKDYKLMFSGNLLTNPEEVGKAVSDFTVNGNEITFSKDWTTDFPFNDIAAIIKFTIAGNIGEEIWCEFSPPEGQCQDNSSAQSMISAGPFDPNYKESSIGEINLSENLQPRQNLTTVRYTIHFQNIGQGSVDSVTVTDVLPAYLTYLGNEASSHSSTPNHNGSSLKWVMGSMTIPNSALDIKGTNDPRQWPEAETKGWIAFDAQISRVNEFLAPTDTCYCLCNTATIYFDSLEHIVTQANIIAIGDSVCFKPISQSKARRWVDEICYDDANFYKTASIKDIVKGNKNNKQITIYPNPTTSVFHIVDISLTPATIEITNHLGQQIEPLFLNSNTIDLSQQPAGFYYIRILTKQGTSKARVIKN